MDDRMFQELIASIKEAGAVRRGETRPARVTEYEDPDPRKIREELNLTRGQFATVLGVSQRTLEGWEQGRRRPSGPARRLLQVAARHPESVLEVTRHG
jgi:putative transcriptional regulator